MANFISEDHIEQATIELFKTKLNYRHLNCMERDTTGRSNETEVVIRPLLRQQLIRLNPAQSLSAIDNAVEQLCQTRMDKNDFVANKEVYGLIRNGVDVPTTNAAGKTEQTNIKVIDYEDDTQNDYLVVSQLWLQGERRVRPDLIVFVNGLPLLFIELKNSNISVRNA